MLNVFTLSASINESINTAPKTKEPIVEEALPCYDFAGNIDETTQNLDYMIMMESLEAKAYSVGADEIMVECAISHPENFDSLCEAAGESFIKRIGAAISKAIAFIGGLIKKLSEWVVSLVAKTGAYKKQMKAAISKCRADSKVEIEGYDHDLSKLNAIDDATKTLVEKYVGKLNDDCDGLADAAEYCYIASKYNREVGIGGSFDHTKVEDINKVLDTRLEDAKKAIDEDAPIYKEFQELLKVSGDHDSVKSVLSGLADSVRGEKTTRKIESNSEASGIVDEMDEAQKSMNGFIDVLKSYQKALNGALKQLNRIKSDDKDTFTKGAAGAASKVAEDKAGEDGASKAEAKKAASAILTKASQLYGALYSRYVGVINQLTMMINASQTTIRTLVNEKIAADVSLLNAYIRADKSAKKNSTALKGEVLPATKEDKAE